MWSGLGKCGVDWGKCVKIPQSSVESRLLSVERAIIIDCLFQQIFREIKRFIEQRSFDSKSFLLRIFFPIANDPALIQDHGVKDTESIECLRMMFA